MLGVVVYIVDLARGQWQYHLSIYLSIYLYICVCVCAFCLYLYVLKYAVALSCLNTSHHETRLWLQKVVWLCEHAGLAQPFFP